MFKVYSSSSSLVITSRWFATGRLVAPVSVKLVYWPQFGPANRGWPRYLLHTSGACVTAWPSTVTVGRLSIKMPSYQYRVSNYKEDGLTTDSSLYGNPSTLKDGRYIETRPLCHQNYFATIVSVGTINDMQYTPYLKQNYYRYIAMSLASSRRGPPPRSPSPCMCDDVTIVEESKQGRPTSNQHISQV